MLECGLETIHMGGGLRSRFICGYLGCDPQISQTLPGGLPSFLQVNIRDDEHGQRLENTLKYSVAQAAACEAGSDAMRTKIFEALVAEMLRRYPHRTSEWRG